MKEKSPEQITIMATMIAVELSEGKCIDELIELKHVLRQAVQSIETMISIRMLKRFEHLEKRFSKK